MKYYIRLQSLLMLDSLKRRRRSFHMSCFIPQLQQKHSLTTKQHTPLNNQYKLPQQPAMPRHKSGRASLLSKIFKTPVNNIPAKKSSHPTNQHILPQQPAMPRHKSGRASVIIQNLQETNQKQKSQYLPKSLIPSSPPVSVPHQ